MDDAITDQANPDMQLQEGDGGPDMLRLARAYQAAITDLNPRIRQDELNYDTRHCVWPGQTPDQRKNAVKAGDTQPFPWKGASDLRVHIVDEVINHGVAVDVLALSKANVRAVAVEGGDLAKAAIVSNFMRWLVLSQMTELPDAAEVLANYRRERGIAVLGVFWDSRVQKTQQKISLAEIADTAPDVATAIQNGLFSDEIAALLRQFFPEVSVKKAKAMVKDLAAKGETTVPFVIRQVNRPMVQPYAIGEDLFLPPNTTDLQSARSIFRKALLSPEQAREKVISEEWDADYVEDAIEHCIGANTTPPNFVQPANEGRFSDDRMGVSGSELSDGLIEFVYAYERLSDEDGVPGIYCTVFCPSVHQNKDEEADSYAKHELLGYRHGMYPFVEFPLEKLSRFLLDSRGQPEVLRGDQDAIKTEVDARRDNSSVATMPPVTHPVGRAPGRIGPGAMVAERRPGEFGFMQVPNPPQASVEIQGNIEARTRRYCGRPTADDATNEWQTKQQKQIAYGWLNKWQIVFRQIFSLYIQFGPDEEFYRVIGQQTDKPAKFVKSDFDGSFDIYLSFDVLNNDPETFQAKLKSMGEIATQFDRNGQVDYSKLLQKAFEMIDPVLAEDVIVPAAMAAQKEVTETQGDISRMWAGVDLDAPKVGVNPQLRMETIKSWMQGVPDNPAMDVQTRLASDENLRKRIERYTKQLQFQVDQFQINPMIGRTGTVPAGSVGQ